VSGKASTPKERFIRRVDGLVEKGNWPAVREACTEFLAGGENCGEAHFLLALAAAVEDDFAAAVAHGRNAVDVDPGVSEFGDFMGVLYGIAGDLNTATYYAKLASTGSPSSQAAAWVPESLPKFTEAFFEAENRHFFRQAMAAASRGEWTNAEHWFRQHLAFQPWDAEAYAGLANALMIQGLNVAAVETLRAARHSVPDDTRVASLLGTALTAVGRFDEARAVHQGAMTARPDDHVAHASAIGDMLFDPAREPQAIATESRAWGERFGLPGDALPHVISPESKRRLTVGYVVGAFDRSQPARALADILARHDSGRFRVVGFGSGQLSDSFNIVFQKCFETWQNTQDTDPLTLASMVAAEDVDILVDVSGLVTPTLLRAFGARMAPVQVSWAGCPYGTGFANMDALLTDDYLDPDDRGATPFREKACRLPKGSPIVELPLARAPAVARSEGRGRVFVADATLAELNVATVAAWSSIVKGARDATLLLLDHDFRSNDATARLIGLFGDFGVAHRIDVVSGIDAAGFFADGDVGLIPFQSMRAEVAVEALMAGIPVVCRSGIGRHRRIVASMLHHAGLAAETVTDSDAAYVDRAIRWLDDVDGRRAFRDGIRDRLLKAPIFDAAGRAADLEEAYLDLWKAVCPETALS